MVVSIGQVDAFIEQSNISTYFIGGCELRLQTRIPNAITRCEPRAPVEREEQGVVTQILDRRVTYVVGIQQVQASILTRCTVAGTNLQVAEYIMLNRRKQVGQDC